LGPAVEVFVVTGVAPLELGQLLQSSTQTARDAAWEGLIAQHTRLILAVARSFGGGSDEAMDRYAFVLEKLREADFRRLRTFRSDAGARFSTWLTITTRRLCLDYHRGVYGRVRDTIQSDESLLVRRIRRNLLEPVDDEQALAAAVDGTATSAERRTMLDERDAILREEIEKLPAHERLLLALRFEDDLPASRIAAIVALPNPFSVYRQLSSTLARLRVALEVRGIDDADG
jgi:RNA polymerase sigma factor (sigma-70 family)